MDENHINSFSVELGPCRYYIQHYAHLSLAHHHITMNNTILGECLCVCVMCVKVVDLRQELM